MLRKNYAWLTTIEILLHSDAPDAAGSPTFRRPVFQKTSVFKMFDSGRGPLLKTEHERTKMNAQIEYSNATGLPNVTGSRERDQPSVNLLPTAKPTKKSTTMFVSAKSKALGLRRAHEYNDNASTRFKPAHDFQHKVLC